MDTEMSPPRSDPHEAAHAVAARIWALLMTPRGAPPSAYRNAIADAKAGLLCACVGLPPRKLARLGELADKASATDPAWFLAQLPELDKKAFNAAVHVRAAAAAAECSLRGVGPSAGGTAPLAGVPIVYERLDLAGRPDVPPGAPDCGSPSNCRTNGEPPSGPSKDSDDSAVRA